jgi:hypothetical protein
MAILEMAYQSNLNFSLLNFLFEKTFELKDEFLYDFYFFILFEYLFILNLLLIHQ